MSLSALKSKNILVAFALFIFSTSTAFAKFNKLDNLIGYKIIAKKTIDGEFEGCDFDKKIIFDDRTMLCCRSYGYQYAYRPTAIILFNGYNIKMIVENEVYDMSR
jgi:hypothetical protein